MKKINYLAVTLACFQIAAYCQGVPYPGDALVRVISVGPGQRDAFVACLAENDLPFWRGLKEKGLLARASVFETTSVKSSEPGVPAWNFVIFSHLAEGANADSFVQAVEKRKGCENAAGAEVRRVETMRSPPKLPTWARETAADDLKARELKVEFSIEYIAVNDTPEALHQWNEYLRLGAPPLDVLIRDEWFFSAVALETVKVNYSQAGMPNWNNIHFLGRIPGKDPTARKAALDAAVNELIPGGTSAWTAKLAAVDSALTTPRVDNVRQLFELAVR